MDTQNMICKRYIRERGTTIDKVMLGYKPVQWSIDPDGPTEYQLVEFFELNGWKETILLDGQIIRATSLDTIPVTVKEKENQHVDDLLKEGYSFLDEVQVNATTKAESSLEAETESKDDYSLSWLLSSPVDASNHALLRGFIVGVFTDGASKLGFDVAREKGSQSQLPDVLMRTNKGYELTVKSGASENTICPTMLEGAGTLTASDGYEPLLMFIYLQRRFEQEFFKDDEKRLVKICGEDGDLFIYDGFDSLEGIFFEFGWNYNEVREAAERLGLVAELFRLDNIDCETEDSYF
jgi:hypothetical protein